MINITLKDGSKKSFPKGISVLGVAKSISEGFSRNVISAKFNDIIIETTTCLDCDGSLELYTWDNKNGKKAFWHSSSHILAQAIQELYKGAKLTIGPAIDKGFYYDVDFGDKSISEKDFKNIESKMLEIARGKHDFNMRSVSKSDALKFYLSEKNEYKVELIKNLTDGEITFCDHSNFTDLCRGGHIPNTGIVKAFKLLSVAGAYWRADEKNKQLTRVYGISFPKQKLLNEYLENLEEAKKRDHRKLGKELNIFSFDDEVGPGLPLWLPNGTAMIDELEKLAKETEWDANYERVRTPHLTKGTLYEKSGHLDHYKDSMYPAMDIDGTEYFVKPMNCPHHHKIYASQPRSYRELPLKLAEYGTCYRYERSGQLFGLMRVRSLQMNDAHIYCTKNQFKNEFLAVCEMYLKYFDIFDIQKYSMRLSLHNEEGLGKKYVNEPKLWLETEEWVREALNEGKINYVEVPGEAAFYGPKIDVQVWSAIGREFTLATNQVDFAVPEKFDLSYVDENGNDEIPLCIHRAPLGTHERFIGFLIEHFGGNFPLWLAPIQVAVLPVSDKCLDYAKFVQDHLRDNNIRVKLNDKADKIGAKIRQAELEKINIMLIVGEKEAENKSVSIRRRFEGDKGEESIDKLIIQLKEEIKNRRISHSKETEATTE